MSRKFEEKDKLKAEIISIKVNTIMEIVKNIALFIGAIIVFLIIQRPESLLNQSLSKETIARERARLLLDLLDEDDPKRMKLGLTLIKNAYPLEAESEWLTNIENSLDREANFLLFDELKESYDYYKSKVVSIEERVTLFRENKKDTTELEFINMQTELKELKFKVKTIEEDMDQLIEINN